MQLRTRVVPTHRTGHRAGGMTLMELMVSIAILAGMVLAFNIILTQSQRVVSETQRKIRANAAAMAISQVIRRDVQSISKNGFLRIVPGKGIMFTVAGTTESVTGNAESSEGVVCYRLGGNAATGKTDDVLCRIALVLSKDASSSSPTWQGGDGDRWSQHDPSDLRTILADKTYPIELDDVLNRVVTVRLPPNNSADVLGLWKVLTYNVSNLKVAWGTRNATGGINWTETGGSWSYINQDSWPQAVKITFQMDPSSIERRALEGSATYEVICPIAK